MCTGWQGQRVGTYISLLTTLYTSKHMHEQVSVTNEIDERRSKFGDCQMQEASPAGDVGV